jgi:predicted nucleic acid-binding protein
VPRPCVLDTSILLSFTGAGRFEIVLDNQRYEWCVTPLVRGELTRREYREPVDAAIAGGRLQLAAVDSTNEAELREWARWSAAVDAAEGEAIAIALSRGWLIAIEDRQAQRALDRTAGTGHWLNSANVLVDAVRDQRLALVEADAVFRSLDCYRGYEKRKVTTLAQLVSAV